MHQADSDVAIAAMLRAGDESAFAALIDQHNATLTRLARNYVRDPALVDEVVQDTWIGLLESLDRFEGRASLKTWLCRILVNVARARLRKESRTIPFSAFDTEERAADWEPAVSTRRFLPRWMPAVGGHWWYPPARWRELPEEHALSAELRSELHRAIAALPDQQRAVITLRDIDGFNSEEVCDLLDISDANQRVLLHRARSKVRTALDSYKGLRV